MYKLLLLFKNPSVRIMRKECVYSSRQLSWSNRVQKISCCDSHVFSASLRKSTEKIYWQTYCNIRHVVADSAGSDIVVHHTRTVTSLWKTNCTPARCFASDVEHQLVAIICPMHHEVVIRRIKRSVIHCEDYMERTKKQGKHQNCIALGERHRNNPRFGWVSLKV